MYEVDCKMPVFNWVSLVKKNLKCSFYFILVRKVRCFKRVKCEFKKVGNIVFTETLIQFLIQLVESNNGTDIVGTKTANLKELKIIGFTAISSFHNSIKYVIINNCNIFCFTFSPYHNSAVSNVVSQEIFWKRKMEKISSNCNKIGTLC